MARNKSGKNKRRADDDLSQSGDAGNPGTSTAGQPGGAKTTRPAKKSKMVATTGESSGRSIDDAINSVLSQSIDFDDSEEDARPVNDITITDLMKKIADQQKTISKLSHQVTCLLSYLGLDDTQLTAFQAASAAEGSSSSDGVATGTETFAKVAARRPVPLSSALKQSVVSAVYRDFEDRDRRNKNIVVNGLPVDMGNDVAAIKGVLENEFGREFTVLKCRRLGRPLSGKIQPLLVTLESPIVADFITSNARQLRQSSNAMVRTSVFINPDITKAEAFAAYQNRVERRKRNASRQQNGQSSTSTTVVRHSSQSVANNVTTCSPSRQHPATGPVPGSSSSSTAGSQPAVDAGSNNIHQPSDAGIVLDDDTVAESSLPPPPPSSATDNADVPVACVNVQQN